MIHLSSFLFRLILEGFLDQIEGVYFLLYLWYSKIVVRYSIVGQDQQ